MGNRSRTFARKRSFFAESADPAEAAHRTFPAEAHDLPLGSPGPGYPCRSPSHAANLAEILPPLPSPARTTIRVSLIIRAPAEWQALISLRCT